MNILMLHNSYQIRGGEDESFESECRMLSDFGHTVDVIHLSNHHVNDLRKTTVALRSIWSRPSYKLVDEALQKRKCDVLHVQNFFPLLSPAVYWAASKHKVPVVQTLRNYRLLCPNALFFRAGKVCEECTGSRLKLPGIAHGCYRNSRAGTLAVAAMSAAHDIMGTWDHKVALYICLTNFARSKFVEAGWPADRLAVKGNFVYPDPGVGDGAGGFALFVGRLTPEKGISTLLTAWEKLDTRRKLTIVGEGPLAPLVREASVRMTNVEWLGPQNADVVKDLMGQASVLVFPSEWYETFGRVAIESFAKGTPVIASRIGAIGELVEDGYTGLLFRPGDALDLTRKLEYLLTQPTLMRSMRAAARARFQQSFTAAENCRSLVALYRNVQNAASMTTRRDFPGS